MPATRRSSGNPRAAAAGRQSTLSFNNRVTKSVPKPVKDLSAAAPPKKTAIVPEPAKAEVAEEPETVDIEVEPQHPIEEAKPQKSEAELRAEKISSKQIDQYWRKLERERIAKRVHQKDLSLAEKVLRYWDVSSQYGPCVGIDRIKRWQRADRLGLNPPVEVLALLMSEEGKGNKGVERAHMDEILNSTAVGSG
ncbi:DNA polymerase delta, subunit 4-domain-containing protein [Xylariomycetidae sp. FL2044]|nr:DNA polymerase delta, subunit 4-domain-containing protein [Xylariomycetidae sp. FL2044]